MPRAVFGVSLHNHARHLPEALESLLAQTERDLALVLVDDASTDGTPAVVEHYTALDERISTARNERRLGLVGTWRRALELARERHPDAPYFAWASDHDAWHPRWLERVLPELDEHPEAVLAYPGSVRVGDRGEFLHYKASRRFDTAGVADPRERFVRFAQGGRAGDMVYGLFRAEELASVPFRATVGPDRLLLAELALHGEFRQVPELLWYRRYSHKVTSRRQREAFFPEGAPASSRMPWPVAHTLVLAREAPVAGTGAPAARARRGLALRYGRIVTGQQARRRLLRPVVRARRAQRQGTRLARLGLVYAGAARRRLWPAGR